MWNVNLRLLLKLKLYNEVLDCQRARWLMRSELPWLDATNLWTVATIKIRVKIGKSITYNWRIKRHPVYTTVQFMIMRPHSEWFTRGTLNPHSILTQSPLNPTQSPLNLHPCYTYIHSDSLEPYWTTSPVIFKTSEVNADFFKFICLFV